MSSTVNDVVINIQTYVDISATFLKMQHTEMFNMVWSNKDYTPEQIVEALGTKAASFFKLSSDTQDLLKEEDPSYIRLATPKKVTINKDGTVTLS